MGLYWLKESVTALMALAIVGFTLWLLVALFFRVETHTVTAEEIQNPALATANQLARQEAFQQRQTVLGIGITLVGVVTGYFFGRVPVERRAHAAENSAKTNAIAASTAQKAANKAEIKLSDVRATVDRITTPANATLGGGAPRPSASVELVALKDRMGW